MPLTFTLQRLNDAISAHTTNWFHRQGVDEVSPAMSVRLLCDRLIHYLDTQKLHLTVSETQFRRNICEFICSYYVSQKRRVPWRGPLSRPVRPRGWTYKYEQEWLDYLRFEHFHSEFWDSLWHLQKEVTWELRVPGWRNAIEYIVLHYVAVIPERIDVYLGDAPNNEPAPLYYSPSDDDGGGWTY